MSRTRTTTKSTPTTSYPLTTQFPPPTTCATNYWFPTVYPDAAPSVVFANGPPIGVATALSECWPPNFDTVGNTSPTFYSPGICPSGYTTASQSYISRTMYAYCCMEDYKLLPDQLPQNVLPPSINPTNFVRDDFTSAVCYQPLQTAIVVTYESINGETYTTDLRKGHSVIQFPIRVKYQVTDFSLFPTDAQPTGLPTELLDDLQPFVQSGLVTIASNTGRKSSSSSSATGAAAPTEPAPSGDDAGGLDETPTDSRTKTIAISVGVTVSVVIILAVLGYLFISWRKKKKRQQGQFYPEATGPYKQQLNDSQVGGIEDCPEHTGGIALADSGGWSKAQR
ncbi:hypothetical protein Dda_9280 [Drechslerella dactyloides]|uniref:Uncharacterized protein n=1 Tax=Drechslerella dactyloides TaxID=74499 RepID=A0AAD6NEK0_DREDA|nr:hypothetical protein Dda_9280 [Drechslerella dactyloides]